jgi:hypothetical protein
MDANVPNCGGEEAAGAGSLLCHPSEPRLVSITTHFHHYTLPSLHTPSITAHSHHCTLLAITAHCFHHCTLLAIYGR